MRFGTKGSKSVSLISLVTVAAFLVSCGSGSGGGGGNSFGGGGGGGAPLEATFASIQANVFTPICVACHAGATAPLGLRLDSANSYALLVGIASGEEPSLLRVEPGDPNNSYIIQKLEGTASTGGRMPLNGTPLSQADINMIRQWITDGALAAPAPPPTGPIRVSSLAPLPGSTQSMPPMTIMAIFDRELDATSVDATTFLVTRSGGDGNFGNGNEVAITPVSVAVPAANRLTAVFDMSTSPPIEDTYRVTLIGTGAATIRDLDSNALDGEYSGAFPSGDGTQGGNFVATFRVEGIQPTLQSIQTHVFTPLCAGCHTGPSSNVLPSGLDLTSVSASYANLVGIASVWTPTVQRVRANDAANSFLIHKLEGTVPGGGAVPGSRMPLGGQPLSPATIATIRQWIDAGAAM